MTGAVQQQIAQRAFGVPSAVRPHAFHARVLLSPAVVPCLRIHGHRRTAGRPCGQLARGIWPATWRWRKSARGTTIAREDLGTKAWKTDEQFTQDSSDDERWLGP
jgi:hypothetical protein